MSIIKTDTKKPDTKFVKAYCKKSKQYVFLEVKKFGSEWKVVNVTFPPEYEGKILTSEVRQFKFYTNENLLPCYKCGGREVGGCNCAPKQSGISCTKGMKYNFNCVYCDNLEIDYSINWSKYEQDEEIDTGQGKKVKIVTFSNVTWTKFDNIKDHPHEPYTYPNEPKIHVITNNENIEFHGYNISEMDEGVYYMIGEDDDFVIECDVDTSTIKPHPGGCFYVSFGLISAEIFLEGGKFFLNRQEVASVGSNFSMQLHLTEKGKYDVVINNKLVGSSFKEVTSKTKITFGFKHGSHHCKQLSHAYIKNIKMKQGIANS